MFLAGFNEAEAHTPRMRGDVVQFEMIKFVLQ